MSYSIFFRKMTEYNLTKQSTQESRVKADLFWGFLCGNHQNWTNSILGKPEIPGDYGEIQGLVGEDAQKP